MTPTNIPPCPKCGVVPEHKEEKEYCTCPHNCGEYNVRLKVESTCDCRHFSSPAVSDFADGSVYDWVETVETLLGRALRELGIETVAQLESLLCTADGVLTVFEHDSKTLQQDDALDALQACIPDAYYLRRRAAEGEK